MSISDTILGFTVSVFIVYLTSIVYFLVSALLTVLVCVLLGYTIAYFSFAGIMIKYDGDKVNFTLAPIRLFAEVGFIKKDLTVKVKLIAETLVIVGMTFISFICLYLLNTSFDTSLYLKSFCIGEVVILIFNWFAYIKFLKQALGKGEEHKLWEYDFIVSNKLKSGVRPRDIEPLDIEQLNIEMDVKNVTAKRCMLWNYFHYLDAKEYDKLEKYILEFRKIIGNTFNVMACDMPYAYEIIYYYSMIGKDVGLAEHYYDLVSVNLRNDNDLNGFRVNAGYLIGTNKLLASALELINKGLYLEKKQDGFVISVLERELLSELKEYAEEKMNYEI